MTDLEFQIAKLELRHGDILVVKLLKGRGMPQHDVFGSLLAGKGVRILYIPSDIELSVLTREEIEARVA